MEPDRNNIRAKVLTVCGGIIVGFNSFLSILCLILLALDGYSYLYIWAAVCGVYYINHGFLSIVSGRNVERFRYCLISCPVIGFIGTVFFIIPVLVLDIKTWINVTINCKWSCSQKQSFWFTEGEIYCNLCGVGNFAGRFLPIFLTVFVTGVINIVLLNVVCRILGFCCYKTSNSQDINIQSLPPPYEFRSEASERQYPIHCVSPPAYKTLYNTQHQTTDDYLERPPPYSTEMQNNDHQMQLDECRIDWCGYEPNNAHQSNDYGRCEHETSSVSDNYGCDNYGYE